MPAANTVDYTTPYYGGFTPQELQLWRAIRDAGGWWSAPELVGMPEFFGITPQKMAHQLARLEEFGHLVRRRDFESNPWLYGFTAVCHAPAGESRRLGEPPEFARAYTEPAAQQEDGHGAA